jgi:hypothetical protein
MRWLLVMPSMMERAAVVATPSSARLLKGTQKYNIRVLNHSCLSARNCATSSGSCGERVEDHCYGAVPGGQSIDSCASQAKTSRAKSYLGRMRVTGLVLPAGLADCTSESQSLVLSIASNFHSHTTTCEKKKSSS